MRFFLTFTRMKKYSARVSPVSIIYNLFITIGIPLIVNNFDGSMIRLRIILVLILIAGITLYFTLAVRYVVEDGKIKIKYGFIRFTSIPISSIREIKKASPTRFVSFDRINVKYEKFDETLLSPKDKDGFVNHLLELNPKIVSDV